MNYYIDFDNTLYNTPLITKRMLNAIANEAFLQKKLDEQDIYNECVLKFNRKNIYNIYELAKYFSNKYSLNVNTIIDRINKEIQNGSDLVFKDSIPFLESLRKNGHNVFLLSYSNGNLQYQSAKILGSGLVDYFDALYITSKPKYELDIDYTNGIFVDDNPSDLLGLYSKNAKKVIRIRRKENKYSREDLENVDIEEFEKLPLGTEILAIFNN